MKEDLIMCRHVLSGFLGLILFVAGCAGPSRVVSVLPGESTIKITASSFDFDPDVIRVREGVHLTLAIENVSGTRHNITVKNPDGQVVVAEDLPAHETVRVEVLLEGPGVYPFYCDRTLHPTFGMKGRLVVEE